MRLLNKLTNKLAYEIELVTQLLVVFIAGITYGILEAIYVPTNTMVAKVIPYTFGHVAYYHLCLLSLMLVASLSLAYSHIQWLLSNKGKYIFWICAANLPLSLMIEDITWFLTNWQKIRQNEWTIIPKGWAVNFGFSYIPIWYFVVFIFSIISYIIANNHLNKGYAQYLKTQFTIQSSVI